MKPQERHFREGGGRQAQGLDLMNVGGLINGPRNFRWCYLSSLPSTGRISEVSSRPEKMVCPVSAVEWWWRI